MSGPLVAKRLAIKLEPPTVYLEYSSVDSSLRRVRAVSTTLSKPLKSLSKRPAINRGNPLCTLEVCEGL